MKIFAHNAYPLVALALLASPIYAEVISISDEMGYNQLLQNPKPAIIKFASDGCGVCRGVKEPFQEISNEDEFAGITFANVSVDTSNELAKKHGVVAVPTFFFIVDGNKIDEEVGVQDMNRFKEDLRTSLRNKLLKKDDQKTEALEEKSSIEMAQTGQMAKGVMGSIMSAISKMIAMVINAIKSMIEAIKNLFSR